MPSISSSQIRAADVSTHQQEICNMKSPSIDLIKLIKQRFGIKPTKPLLAAQPASQKAEIGRKDITDRT